MADRALRRRVTLIFAGYNDESMQSRRTWIRRDGALSRVADPGGGATLSHSSHARSPIVARHGHRLQLFLRRVV